MGQHRLERGGRLRRSRHRIRSLSARVEIEHVVFEERLERGRLPVQLLRLLDLAPEGFTERRLGILRCFPALTDAARVEPAVVDADPPDLAPVDLLAVDGHHFLPFPASETCAAFTEQSRFHPALSPSRAAGPE